MFVSVHLPLRSFRGGLAPGAATRYNRVMAGERRAAVLIKPLWVYTNPQS